MKLEEEGAGRSRQPDLFAAPSSPAPAIEPALRAALLAIDPDILTPRQALDALYQLKRLLDE